MRLVTALALAFLFSPIALKAQTPPQPRAGMAEIKGALKLVSIGPYSE